MIRLNGIVVKFGDFTALHKINIHVKEGEFFTFLGPSGCGKNTTLRSITGFIDPGAVEVKGRDITHVPIESRNTGIVSQPSGGQQRRAAVARDPAERLELKEKRRKGLEKLKEKFSK